MDDFSAAFYSGWTRDELVAEAGRLGVQKIDTLHGNRLIDAVYNAELRRRQAELEAAEAQVAQPVSAPQVVKRDYEEMTVQDLRDLAESRSLSHKNAKNKADLVEMLRNSDDQAKG